MNRIETKMIIMVTNRLAEAKESNAKTEMIEELSENLYQRYLELTAQGMPEEEALAKAQESLGDVEELLAFLKEEEEEENAAKKDGEDEEEDGKASFFRDDLESGFEEIVNAAVSTAKVAVDCAKDMAKGVSEQFKEKCPEGAFTKFAVHRGKKVDCTAIPPEGVDSLEIRLTNGNITLKTMEEENAFIEIAGDTEEIETMLREDGILSISQGNTASAAYFFMRGMRRSDLEVRLPKKLWDKVTVETVHGEIHAEEGLTCRRLEASTASGNLMLEGVGGKIEVHSHSGDICGRDMGGDFYGETKSGNIQIGGDLEACRLFSASGDVFFDGKSGELNCSSTSGTVELLLAEMPGQTKGNSISGSCIVQIPVGESFSLSYRTVSGTFLTNLPFTGELGEKSGHARSGEPAEKQVSLTSVSGDISICGK